MNPVEEWRGKRERRKEDSLLVSILRIIELSSFLSPVILF